MVQSRSECNPLCTPSGWLTVKFVLDRDFGNVRMFRVVGCLEVLEAVGCSDVLDPVPLPISDNQHPALDHMCLVSGHWTSLNSLTFDHANSIQATSIINTRSALILYFMYSFRVIFSFLFVTSTSSFLCSFYLSFSFPFF